MALVNKTESSVIHQHRAARKITNKVLDMIDNGLLDPKDVVLMCLKWMSEDDVAEMCKANEIYVDEDEENV